MRGNSNSRYRWWSLFNTIPTWLFQCSLKKKKKATSLTSVVTQSPGNNPRDAPDPKRRQRCHEHGRCISRALTLSRSRRLRATQRCWAIRDSSCRIQDQLTAGTADLQSDQRWGGGRPSKRNDQVVSTVQSSRNQQPAVAVLTEGKTPKRAQNPSGEWPLPGAVLVMIGV